MFAGCLVKSQSTHHPKNNRVMRQAFVRASSPGDGIRGTTGHGSSKKRRRALPGEGEIVSAIYEDIIRLPGKTPHWSTKSGSNEDTGAGSFDYPLEFARHGTAASAHTRRKDDNASGAHSSGTHSSNSHSGFANDEEAASAPIFGPAPRPSGMESKPVEGFLCRVCDEFVTSLSEDKHNTSTLHIFNQQHKPTERKVQICESNKGFQLLEGMGWKVDEGLGPRKQGRVNPLQTTYKRDTTGLGAGGKKGRLRARVTHFPSHVPSQALNSSDGKSDAIRAHESLDNNHHNARRRDHRRRRGNPDNSGGSTLPNGAEDAPGERVVADAGGGFWGQGTHSDHPPADGGVGRHSSSSSTARSRSSSRKKGAGSGHFLSRKESKAIEERERRKERKTRFDLFSDVPEEFAALFTS